MKFIAGSRKRIGLLLFFFSLISASGALALQIPEKPQRYVNDYIQLLSSGAREKMENTLTEFEKSTSTQVVVAVFDSLEGGSLEDFSIRLAEKWKIGQKGKDNGVILLIFKSDRKVRIEVGYGLEGALPDVIAQQIIQNDIVPNFRAGNYDAGVEKAVADILLATKGEYAANPEKGDERGKALILLILMILIIVILIERTSSGRTYSGRTGYFGGWGGGFGSGGSGGGGGFSGGGGGSFGGGGSSGSW